jgi:hypothetical protein
VAGGGRAWGGQRRSGRTWGGWRRHLGATDGRAWGRRRTGLGQVADAPVASLGAFDRVARGPGCAPWSPVWCLASFSSSLARLPTAKSTPSAWLICYSRILRFLGHGSTRLMAGDFGRRGVALVGSHRNGETSAHAPSSANSFSYISSPLIVVASFSYVPSAFLHSREIPALVVWWYATRRACSLAGFLFVPPP